MTSRYIVVGPRSANVTHNTTDELVVLLGERGSLEHTNILVGVDTPSATASPQAALLNVLEILYALKADFILVDGIDALDARTFDAVSWNLELTASAQAGVVLVLDAEGMGTELLVEEIRVFAQRVEATQTELVAMALPAGATPTVEAEVPVLPLPFDAQALNALLTTPAPNTFTPLAFQADPIDRARTQRKRIAMPEPEDDRVLLTIAEVLTRGTTDITLVSEADVMSTKAAELGIGLSTALVVSVGDPAHAEKYAVEFARPRTKKGVTTEQTCEKIKDVSHFAIPTVHMGDADGMVSGAAHTITYTIVPPFQIIKIAPGVSIVSSIFPMLIKDQVWAFDDCAVNPNPAPEQFADIAVTSARTAAQFGVEPRVAMLSYSTGTSGSGPAADAVVEVTRLIREKVPELASEGSIQFDAAVDMMIAAKKFPGSPVVGRANVFVFPSLETGSIGYEAVRCSSGAVAVGPVLQGLNKPVNGLSRGVLVEDIVNTVALTAVQAQG